MSAVTEALELSKECVPDPDPTLIRGFELLTGTPNGVASLREVILSLAMQGKLVPQDSNDEPASKLLARIHAKTPPDKSARRTRGADKSRSTGDGEGSQLPRGWARATLEDVSIEIVDCPHSTPKFASIGRLCIDTNSFKEGKLLPHKLRYVDEETFSERTARLRPQPGDLVFAREGSVGQSLIIPDGTVACLGQRVMLFRFSSEVSNEFIRTAITSAGFLSMLLGLHKGIGAKHVNVADMRRALISLPPLAEQRRIVARVEELMKLCDALEENRRLADEQHARLVAALFDAMSGESDTALAENWRRIADHFDLLFDRPAAIDALEKVILQLAVQGLLVPQDKEEGSAAELLEQFRAKESHGKLVRRGRTPLDLAPVTREEIPFVAPTSWEWARFGTVARVASNLVSPLEFQQSLQVGPDCIEKATGRLIESRSVRDSGVISANHRFRAGQILYSKIRPSLSKAIVVDFDGLCSADMYPIDTAMVTEYLHLFMLSGWFLDQVVLAENRVKMPKLNQEALNSFLVAVPPFAEQRRIVAHVHQLRSLCAELRGKLTEARVTEIALADSLVADVMC